MARVGEKELKSMPVKNALEGMQGKLPVWILLPASVLVK